MRQFGSAVIAGLGPGLRPVIVCPRGRRLDDRGPTHGLRFHKVLELGRRTLPDRDQPSDELVDDILGMYNGVTRHSAALVVVEGAIISVLSDATMVYSITWSVWARAQSLAKLMAQECGFGCGSDAIHGHSSGYLGR